MSNETTDSPTYTPGAADAGTTVTLSVEVIGNGTCATVNDTKPLFINIPPTPTFTSGAATACLGDSEIYTTEPGQTNYIWNVSGGVISIGGSGSSIVVDWTGVAPYEVSINYTDANGCTASTPTVLAVNVINTNLTLTQSPDPGLCVGSSIELSAGGDFDTFEFRNGVGGPVLQTASADNTFDATSFTDGQIIEVEGFSATCGTFTETITVSVNPATALVLSQDPNPGCNDGSTIEVLASAGFDTYEFRNGVGGPVLQAASADNSYDDINLTDGQIIEVVATSATCGNLTETITLDVVAPIVLTLAQSPDPSCSGASVEIIATTGFDSYEFRDGIGGPVLQAASGDNTYDATNFTDGQVIEVEAISSACGTTIQTISVNISSVPALTLTQTPDAGLCTGTFITVEAVAGYDTYEFRNGVGGPVLQAASAVNTFSSTSFTDGQVIEVEAFSATCGTIIEVITININVTPTLTITQSPDPGLCAGSSIEITATAGFDTYEFRNGVGGPVIQAASANNTFDAITFVDGQIIEVVATSATCGDITDNITVSVNPALSLTLSQSPDPGCLGGSIEVSATTGFDTYIFRNGVSGPVLQAASADNSFDATNFTNGQTIEVEAFSATCGTIIETISLNVSSPITLTLNQVPDPGCAGGNVEISATAGFDTYEFRDGVGGPVLQAASATETFNSTALTNGQIIEVEAISGACGSVLETITVSVSTAPTLALVQTPDPALCPGVSVEISATLGFDSYEFRDGIGGPVLQVDSPSEIFTSTSLTDTQVIEVAATLAGCGTVTETITVNISATPTLSLSQTPDPGICAGTAVDIEATPGFDTYEFRNGVGGPVLQAASASEVFSSSSLSAGQVIEVEAVSATCGTFTETISVNIILAPSAPSVSGTTIYCVNETTITDLTVAGGVDINWYSDAGLTNQIGSGNTFDPETGIPGWSVAAAGTFNVFVTETNLCDESVPTAVTIQIVSTTPAPTGDSNQSFCSTSTPTIDDIIVSGTGIQWYDAASGGNLIAAGTALTDATTYHASQTIGGCGESTTRLAVAVSLFTSTPAPTGNATQTFCNASSPTIGNLAVTGTGIQWYDASTGGNLLADTDLLVDGTTYHASQTDAGCGESTSRLAVTVSVVTSTPAPTGSSGQTFCPVTNATLANFNVFGTGITWYSTSTSTTPLANNTPLVNGTTYFATQTIPGCGESTTRLAVTATILAANDPLCSGGGGGTGGPICSDIASLSVTDVINPDCGLENGSLTISVEFNADPGNIIYGLKYFDADLADSVFTTQLNDSVFNTLAALNYRYFVTAGVDTCFLDFNLASRTTVDASITSTSTVTCSGETGTAVVQRSGSSTGSYFYSIDGGVSWQLLSGDNTISGLTAGSTTTVLIGESVGDTCPAEVEAFIPDNSVPIVFDARVTQNLTTCDSNDGEVQVDFPPSGGANAAGDTWEIAFKPSNIALLESDFGAFTESLTFRNLVSNTYTVFIRDISGCTVTEEFVITTPGQIEIDEFNSFAQSASCDAPSSGSVVMRLANLGAVSPPFNVSIATADDPENPVYVDDQGWNGDTRIFPRTGDGLLSGDYIATVSSNTDGICAGTFEFTIDGGPVPVSFDYELQQSCFGTTREYVNELLLTDITGEAGIDYVLTVFNDQQQVVDMLTLTLQIGNQIRVTNRSFLQTPDRTFRLRLGQSQNACPDNIFFDHPSSLEVPEIVAPLSVEVGNITSSLPERSTGTFDIVSISGGVSPFNAVLEGDVPGFGGLGPDEVPFDAFSGKFTLGYNDLGVGDYDLFVIDALGCEIELDIDIPRDSSLFIPNVITPNGDGINDYFVIRNLDISSADKGANLIITSRWGKQIYSSDNYTNENPWGGDEAAEGLFFYKLEAGGKVYTGWLEVIFGGSP
ncbi:gliding motility-associated C-terminal domain-containing protein [Fulvivirga sp.]|uniref:gliding motility-associated C-terminal domain-containing protein n=1 Tax=Fulvivirga sp. TaxID=1931237 RepID=UPI0032ECDDD4